MKELKTEFLRRHFLKIYDELATDKDKKISLLKKVRKGQNSEKLKGLRIIIENKRKKGRIDNSNMQKYLEKIHKLYYSTTATNFLWRTIFQILFTRTHVLHGCNQNILIICN